eukprot:XP_011681101.1 PREDICTED: protein FAM43A-like [Strongylocentrotus purpuratus]
MSIIPDVFKWRQQRFIVTPKDTEYTLRYLGSMRTLGSRGKSCCDYPIRKIWKNTECGERYVKAKMYLGTKGMRLVRAGGVSSSGERKGDREQFFHLHRINCCRTDSQHPTVFAWIYRHELPRLQLSPGHNGSYVVVDPSKNAECCEHVLSRGKLHTTASTLVSSLIIDR